MPNPGKILLHGEIRRTPGASKEAASPDHIPCVTASKPFQYCHIGLLELDVIAPAKTLVVAPYELVYVFSLQSATAYGQTL